MRATASTVTLLVVVTHSPYMWEFRDTLNYVRNVKATKTGIAAIRSKKIPITENRCQPMASEITNRAANNNKPNDSVYARNCGICRTSRHCRRTKPERCRQCGKGLFFAKNIDRAAQQPKSRRGSTLPAKMRISKHRQIWTRRLTA